MRITFVILSILFCSFFGFGLGGSLDPLYSQYMFNQLALNPAYAGSRDVMSIYALTRRQWAGVDGGPNTQVISVHSPLMNRKVGLGLQILGDQIGPQKNSGVFASYAYRIRFKNAHFSFGARVGTYTYRYDQNKISYKDPLENAQPTTKETHYRADFGIYYNSKTWYWGWSIIHLADINTSSSTYLPTIHRYLTVGKAFQASKNLIINPSILLKSYDKTSNMDVNINFLLRQKLWMGFSLRKNSMPLLLQFVASEHLKIGLSWDLPVGKVVSYLGTSTEVLLQWDLNVRKTKTLSPRYL